MKRLFLAIVLALSVSACLSPKGNTTAEKRNAVRQMRSETLAELYQVHPDAKSQIAESSGYAVFSNMGMNLFVLSTGSGWGVVRDNGSKDDTYMKMASGGYGVGMGVKEFRGVFVFTSQTALEKFVHKGWQASAQVDAAAKASDRGEAWANAIDVAPDVKLYQLTEQGLALQATVQGTKFWQDNELN